MIFRERFPFYTRANSSTKCPNRCSKSIVCYSRISIHVHKTFQSKYFTQQNCFTKSVPDITQVGFLNPQVQPFQTTQLCPVAKSNSNLIIQQHHTFQFFQSGSFRRGGTEQNSIYSYLNNVFDASHFQTFRSD